MPQATAWGLRPVAADWISLMTLEVDVARDWVDYVTAFGTAGAAIAAALAAIIAVRQSREQSRRRLYLWGGLDTPLNDAGDATGERAYLIEATNISWRPI